MWEAHGPSGLATALIRSIPGVSWIGGPLTVGTRAIIRQPKLPPGTDRWLWRFHRTGRNPSNLHLDLPSVPGLRVIARQRGSKPAAHGSRATLSLRFSGVLAGLFAHITRGLNDRYLALEAKGLKQRSESRSPQSEPRP